MDDSTNKKEYNADDLIKIKSRRWLDAWEEFDNNDSERYTDYITRKGNKTGCILDYAFISPELEKQINNISVHHDSEKRENKMTDHSSLILEYSL